jgi:hypothetical protein
LKSRILDSSDCHPHLAITPTIASSHVAFDSCHHSQALPHLLSRLSHSPAPSMCPLSSRLTTQARMTTPLILCQTFLSQHQHCLIICTTWTQHFCKRTRATFYQPFLNVQLLTHFSFEHRYYTLPLWTHIQTTSDCLPPSAPTIMGHVSIAPWPRLVNFFRLCLFERHHAAPSDA